jgi:hypothetical protein
LWYLWHFTLPFAFMQQARIKVNAPRNRFGLQVLESCRTRVWPALQLFEAARLTPGATSPALNTNAAAVATSFRFVPNAHRIIVLLLLLIAQVFPLHLRTRRWLQG